MVLIDSQPVCEGVHLQFASIYNFLTVASLVLRLGPPNDYLNLVIVLVDRAR